MRHSHIENETKNTALARGALRDTHCTMMGIRATNSLRRRRVVGTAVIAGGADRQAAGDDRPKLNIVVIDKPHFHSPHLLYVVSVLRQVQSIPQYF